MADLKSTIVMCIFAISMTGMSESESTETAITNREETLTSMVRYILMNTSITLNCEFASHAIHKRMIKWYFESDFGEYQKKHLSYNDNKATSTVTLKSANDTGSYSCEVTGVFHNIHFKGSRVSKLGLPWLQDYKEPEHILKGQSKRLECTASNSMKKPQIAWYFKGVASRKTYLNVDGTELSVTIKSADDVGVYSCEFFEADQPQTIKKMIMLVTSNVGSQKLQELVVPGTTLIISSSSSIANWTSTRSAFANGGTFVSLSGNVSNDNFDQQILHFARRIITSIKEMKQERPDFGEDIPDETVYNVNFQVSNDL